ncbi:MAG TPA: carboxypeptidase-like regulatory domain-containing protein [Prolixibacteraceae bacterium]|nr:carboxypeptidase-like regulatory domain-containing protein [Prolixibacteraceae bacterium]
MKFSPLILLVISLLTATLGYSQGFFQSVSGRVIDKDSQEPLPGATVTWIGSDPLSGTICNTEGYFRLNKVPVGRQTFRISYLGYKEVVIPQLLVTSGKEVVLNIELTENLSQLNEVKVVAAQQNMDKSLNTMASISARRLNMEDAGRYAGGFYDPSRMVSAFAGVSAVEGDGVNDIVIRGNSSRGLQWRLEGIEIPNPNHFTDGQGATGGAVSIITSNMLSTSDFYTGAFPAEYGNASSGVMDLNLRVGNPDKKEYAFQLGVVGTEFTLEGGFSKKSNASYLLNYRYSTFGYLSKMGLIDLGNNNLPPIFQDVTANFNFPSKKVGTFTLFTVAGNSHTGTEPEKSPDQRITYDDQYYETENHGMMVAGIKHIYLLPNKKTFLKTVVAYTSQSDKWEDGTRDRDDQQHTRYNNNFEYPSVKASILVNSKINERNLVRTGVVIDQMYYDLFQRERNFNTLSFDTILNQSGQSTLYQAYAQWKYRLTENFEFNSGIHVLYFALNEKSAVEPRVGIKYQIDERRSLSFGYGLHSKTEAISTYMALIPDDAGNLKGLNKDLGFHKSMHWVLGYDDAFSKNWRAKIETYYQHIYQIPVPLDPNSTISAVNFGYGIPDQQLVNKGIAYNYGVEFTIEKFFTDNYYLLTTFSAFDSKYRGNNHQWYNTVYNAGHVGNFLAGKDFKLGKSNQNIVGINSKVVWRGGYRISPIDTVATQLEKEMQFDEQRMNENKLPDFFRIDFGTYLRVNKPGYSYILSLDIQNIINRKNTIGYEFSDEKNNIAPIEAMGLIPILNFRIEF